MPVRLLPDRWSPTAALIAAPLRWIAGALAVLLVGALVAQAIALDGQRRRADAAVRAAATAEARADALARAVRAAAAAARAADLANQARVDQARAAAIEEATRAQDVTLADYRRRLARRLDDGLRVPVAGPAPAARSGAGADLPGDAAVSAGPVPPATAALVPVADLDACAVAFARLDALIAAWTRAAAVPDSAPPPAADADEPAAPTGPDA